MSGDRICTECLHRVDHHDSIGCNDETVHEGLPQPCYCTTGIDFRTREPVDGAYA